MQQLAERYHYHQVNHSEIDCNYIAADCNKHKMERYRHCSIEELTIGDRFLILILLLRIGNRNQIITSCNVLMKIEVGELLMSLIFVLCVINIK